MDLINLAAKPLLGQKVTHTSIGYAGSIFLEFGELHKITKHKKNGESYSYYKGKHGVSFFHYWEFEKDDVVVLKWEECTDEQINAVLPLIDGSIFESIKVEASTLDTTIGFSGNVSFHIKNPSRKDSSFGALMIKYNRQYFEIGPGNEVSLQKSSSAE